MDLKTALPFLDTKVKYASINPCPSCQEIKEQKEKEKVAKKKEREAKAEANHQKKAGKAKPKKETQKKEEVKSKETSTPEELKKPMENNSKTLKPAPVTRQKYRYATHIISGKYRSKKYPLRYPVKPGDPRIPKLTAKEWENLRIHKRVEPVNLSWKDYIHRQL